MILVFFFCLISISYEHRYVEKENLVKPTDKAKVILDVTLCDALYKGAIKKGTSYPTEIHKDLGSTFLNRMQVHHRVSRGNEVVVLKGAIRTLQIMTERRQGNKKMTQLSGVESFLMDPNSLASELQKKFACSTTTAELPGIMTNLLSILHILRVRFVQASYRVKDVTCYVCSHFR
jgi:translation initiation factor 2D